MNLVKKRLPYAILILSIILGGYLRFYKLDWGEGYFFHPDEYHIIGAVGRLIRGGLFENPKLFSYGSFTVYLIYVARWLLFSLIKIDGPNIFIIGRFLSALFSTLTLFNIYLIAKYIFPNKRFFPETAVLTSAFIPGLIQQAHFLTPESFITFWITLSAYFFIKYFRKQELNNLIFSGVFIGLAGGIKISSFAVMPFFLITIFFLNFKKNGAFNNLKKIALYIAACLIFFFAVFPYSILDYQSFKNTTRYESSLSTGTIRVFYTRSFNNSVPFLFQLKQIYPYTLGATIYVFSLIGILLVIFRVINFHGLKAVVFCRLRLTPLIAKTCYIHGINTMVLSKAVIKNEKAKSNLYIILGGVFLSYFVFNSILFTKWTRFVHPTIPFLILLSFIAIFEITEYFENSIVKKQVEIFLLTLLIFPTIIWGVMFFSIYQRGDVRITATDWVNKNIAKNTTILTETGNTLEVPLQGNYNIIPFDFYNVDNNPILFNNLVTDISRSDYFIIQSRRIFLNHDKSMFPVVYNFYNALFSNKLGFEEIKTFISFPQLKLGKIAFEINDEPAEETWSVFDHPVIRIFKKNKLYPTNYYDQILR
jgi:hypothetical protein